MKKLYKNPFIVIREMETEEMIASSLDLEKANTVTFENTDATGEALSRKNSTWSDDDEE